jgi:hypothetical protein
MEKMMFTPTPQQTLEFAFYTQITLLDGYKEDRFIGDSSMVSMATATYQKLATHYKMEESIDWPNQASVIQCYAKTKEAIQRTGALNQWFKLGEELAIQFIESIQQKARQNRGHLQFLQRLQEAKSCSSKEEPCLF